MSAALLAALTKAKVKIIFCDEKHLPSAELVPYYGAHDSTRKIRAQAKWSEATKAAVWTAIVAEKIRKQEQLLKKLGSDRHAILAELRQHIVLADATNREGQAARVYFAALFGLDFSRGSDTSINAALNYGYNMLMAAFCREIVACGYVTQLGLCHDSVYNPYNLASDLMEPYRPLVDEAVHAMQPQWFTHDEKRQLVQILNRTVVLNNRSELVSNAIRLYCLSVFDAIDHDDVSRIRWYDNEL